MPTTHYIYVNATRSTPWPPAISDDEGHFANTTETDKELTTDLDPGDTVVWVKYGDIDRLEEVALSEGQDIFVEDPTQQSDGTWKATVVSDLPDGATCEYNISYTLAGMFYTQDPKLTLRPSVGGS